MRYVKVSVVQSDQLKRRIMIPEMWLVGACQTREHDGMSPKEAIQDSIAYWLDQERLEIQWNAEHTEIS